MPSRFDYSAFVPFQRVSHFFAGLAHERSSLFTACCQDVRCDARPPGPTWPVDGVLLVFAVPVFFSAFGLSWLSLSDPQEGALDVS